MILTCLSPCAAALALQLPAAAQTAELRAGPWRAWLDSPGGELPFGLVLAPGPEANGWKAAVVNGSETIEVPGATFEGSTLTLDFPHYDSRILAEAAADGVRLDGTWTMRRGPDEWTRMGFHAVAGDHPRFPKPELPEDEDLSGMTDEELTRLAQLGSLRADVDEERWTVDFASSDDPAVLVLRRGRGDEVTATFLTTTGDYRYLAGRLGLDGLFLSCFDGAHAFLFEARAQWPGLRGDFWSRDTWHETWAATWTPHAELPDPFEQTTWDESVHLAELVFPDLDGVPRSLADPAFAGKARVLQVFGSWCPNCHDEAPFLVELHERYAEEGLSIVGLAFELTGDFERDARQLRVYRDRYGIPFPILVGGLAQKDKATAAFGALDRVRSYPTTIFMDAMGTVQRIHTGFTGPGTGEEYQELQREFTRTIESLLAMKEPKHDKDWKFLTTSAWVRREAFGGVALHFSENEAGERFAKRQVHGREGVVSEETFPVTLHAGTVFFAGEVWIPERKVGILTNPTDFGARLSADPKSATPLLPRIRIETEEDVIGALAHEELVVRREALVALAHLRAAESERSLSEALPFLEAPETSMRVAAAWAVGHALEEGATEALFANLEHPRTALRRESARSLVRLATVDPSILERLSGLEPDPDPLVRAVLEDATNR